MLKGRTIRKIIAMCVTNFSKVTVDLLSNIFVPEIISLLTSSSINRLTSVDLLLRHSASFNTFPSNLGREFAGIILSEKYFLLALAVNFATLLRKILF